MQQRGASIRVACAAFEISETCYRYQAEYSAENVEIGDHLIRLTHNQRNWGFGLWPVLSVPAKRQGLPLEPQAGRSDLPRALAQSAHQAAPVDRAREARAAGGAGGDQPVLVNGLYARSAG